MTRASHEFKLDFSQPSNIINQLIEQLTYVFIKYYLFCISNMLLKQEFINIEMVFKLLCGILMN